MRAFLLGNDMSLKLIRYGLGFFVFGLFCFFIGAVLREFSIDLSDDLLWYVAAVLAVGFISMLIGVLLRYYDVWKYKNLRKGFEDIGYGVIEGVLDGNEVEELIEEIGLIVAKQEKQETGKRKGGGYAIRDLLGESKMLQCFASSEKLKKVARGMLGEVGLEGQVMCVNAIFFDKNEDANWLVPLHQDLTICVDRRHDFEGYGPWSVKEGVDCVQPPVEILEGIVTLRIHLGWLR